MITLYHGDNTVASRDQLNLNIKHAKSQGIKDIVRLDGKKLDLTELVQALEAKSLFGGDRLVVIENLLSRPKSKEKQKLCDFLKTSTTFPSTPNCLLWENKPATPAQLKSLGQTLKHTQYKLTKSLFTLLESLSPNNAKVSLGLLNLTLQQEAAELVFVMLARQLRLLLQLKSNTPVKLAPWQKTKLQAQANKFHLNQLLQIYQDMIQIDYQAKTGQSALSLANQLDILIAKI